MDLMRLELEVKERQRFLRTWHHKSQHSMSDTTIFLLDFLSELGIKKAEPDHISDDEVSEFLHRLYPEGS